MATDFINRTLTPSDKGGSEGEEQERIERLLAWVSANYLPEDVFTAFELGRWAVTNGYSKPLTTTY